MSDESVPMSAATSRGTTIKTARTTTVFEIRNVVKDFTRKGRRRRSKSVLALDDVSLDIVAGEALGVVGESGSGKTTLARILLGFERSTSGTVRYRGDLVATMNSRARHSFRHQVQMVFQNPYSSLNPFRTVRSALSDGYRAHRVSSKEKSAAMTALMQQTGLSASMLDRYPHEFSGGQRQRIVLARALSVGPDVLIADEPVSALDVSIQAQVLNLLNSLRRELNLTIVMVTHDLRVVNFFCDRIAVMYLGRLIELGTREEIMQRSRHPYTRMLISAAPRDKPGERRERPFVRSEIDTDGNIGSTGCNFAARCWLRTQLGNPTRCVTERPELISDGEAGTQAACHFADQVDEFAAAQVLP